MSIDPRLPPTSPAGERRLWTAYVGACALAWLLYVLAGTEFQRGLWQLWESVYQASLSLWAPMVLGAFVYPWLRHLASRPRSTVTLGAAHAVAALLFGALWQAGESALSWCLYGAMHALATFAQTVLWRALWGVVVYAAIAAGFNGVLQGRRARASSLAAAEAESARARAELAAISGKLNPHFLFNTLNTLIALTRKDPRAAEEALMRFSGMLRYVLDSKRGASDRVALADEIAFVRDYLALESLRLGQRLRVDWQLDPETLDDEIPALSLQPLVENSVLHGIAPSLRGGSIVIGSRRDAQEHGLALHVEDDGPGCDPARLEAGPDDPRRGIGLAALRQRFALDYDGRARFRVRTAPDAGFRVDLWIPQT